MAEELYNKDNLRDDLWAIHGAFTQSQANTAVDFIFKKIISQVSKGKKVNIAGFGVFKPKIRKARECRNPRTGELISVGEMTVVGFTPSKTFRQTMKGEIEVELKRFPRY